MSPSQRSVLRVTPRFAANAGKSCPRYLALKARPEAGKRPARRQRLETFADQPVRDVLDRIEFEDMSVAQAHREHRASKDGSRCHPGLLRWTDHAVQNYLRAGESLSEANGHLRPRSREWAVQYPIRPRSDQDVFEIRAAGRFYESEDGRVREIRLPRTYSVDPANRSVPPPGPPELAAIAIVLAEGRTVLGKWTVPLGVSPASSIVERVRVVEIGLTDGSWDVALDEPTVTVRELYETHARHTLRGATRGESYLPGRGCVRCPERATCPELLRRPGLLGIHDRTRPARTWSVTTGRNHQDCPAHVHLRDLWLPYQAGKEYGLEARRGKAVHHWLEQQHDRQPPRPCRAGEVPLGPSWWPSWQVPGQAALLGEQMIGDHALRCPIPAMGATDTIRSEQDLVVYDPEADVVVHAKVDTVYTEGGTVVVRETKTTERIHDGDLVRTFPQIALALVLGAEGVFGPACRIELERLTAAGSLLDKFSPGDAWLVRHAREVVRDLAAPWHADQTMASRPGKQCRTCEMTQWCPDAEKDSE